MPILGKDQAKEASSQLEITRVERNNDCFYPGDVEWQQRTCQELGLEYQGLNGIEPGSRSTPLTSPTGFKIISGDGNCMFRAFSFIITGSEDQLMQVRQAIVRHREPLAQACGKVKSLPFYSICAPLEKCQRTAMGHCVLSPEQMESTNTLLPLK